MQNKILSGYMDKLQQSLNDLDGANTAELQHFRDIQMASRVIIQAQSRQMAAELGSNHPVLAAVSEALQLNLGLLNELEGRLERSRVKATDVADEEVLVQGIVADEYSRGVPEAKVSLLDEEGNELAIVTATDSAGHFAFVLGAATVESIKNKKVTYAVARSDGEPLYQHAESFELAAGDRSTMSVTIARSQAYPWLRKVKATSPSRSKTARKPGGGTELRYLGNSKSHEIHDLNNIKKNCQIDEIAESHRVSFRTQKEAKQAGYDFCAYCFGKQKSKR